jgi:hypothetical protein
MSPNRFNILKTLDAVRDSRVSWLGSPERVTLMMLVLHADADGIAWPSQPRLAEEGALSERRVRDAIRVLAEEKAIVVVEPGRQHRSARYSVSGTLARLCALRAEQGASLSDDREERGAGLPISQGGRIRTSGRNQLQSREEPAAGEGTHLEGTQKKAPISLAGAREPVHLDDLKPEASATHAVIKTYSEAYVTRTGLTPKRIGGGGGKAAKMLADTYGNEAHAIVRRCMSEWKGATPMLPSILRHAESFRGTGPQATRSSIHPAPPNGSAWLMPEES